MKFLHLFLAFALFNYLAIDASSNPGSYSNTSSYSDSGSTNTSRFENDKIADQSKEDTLAIINSYLERERNENNNRVCSLNRAKKDLENKIALNAFKEGKPLIANYWAQDCLDWILFHNHQIKSEATLKAHKSERLDFIAGLQGDLKFKYSESFNNVHKEYSAVKNKHFEHYFSVAVKYLAEDKK